MEFSTGFTQYTNDLFLSRQVIYRVRHFRLIPDLSEGAQLIKVQDQFQTHGEMAFSRRRETNEYCGPTTSEYSRKFQKWKVREKIALYMKFDEVDDSV